jgi:hypothetical protein
MALVITAWTITSDLTPESARYTGAGHWSLSWLPGATLTRDQALSGMILDDTLSDLRLADNSLAAEVAALHAAALGMSLAQALIRLYTRTTPEIADEGRNQLGDNAIAVPPAPLVTNQA